MTDGIRLLYTSFAAPDVTDATVRELVRRARGKNAALQVTGLLIYDGLCFCQYLEGPSEALYPLLGEIRTDRRHLNFLLQDHARLDAPRRFDTPLAFAYAPDPAALDRIANAPDARISGFEEFLRLLPKLRIES